MDLEHLARKYIWWISPAQAVLDRRRLTAQVLELGTFEDVQALRSVLGDEALVDALQRAQPGEFSERSWNYWHLILGLASIGHVPRVPVRKFA